MHATLDKEDVKHLLRKRFGTVGKFAEARGLTKGQVADFMRGRTSAPVAQAIADELQVDAHNLSMLPESTKLDDNAKLSASHRLNSGAR